MALPLRATWLALGFALPPALSACGLDTDAPGWTAGPLAGQRRKR